MSAITSSALTVSVATSRCYFADGRGSVRDGELAERLEVRDTDAHQAQRARAVTEGAVEELAGEVADRLRVVDSGWERGRAAADGEVGIADLRRDRPGAFAS